MKAVKSSSLQRHLGHRIRQLREQLGVSQERLSFESGLDRTYISGVERAERNPTLLTLEKIAQALQVSLKDLFDF
jgi:transcriptional regulator with XRE-family HTH domain